MCGIVGGICKNANLFTTVLLSMLLLACQNDTPTQTSVLNSTDNQTQSKINPTLYYFEKDNSVGVKDDNGNIIIEPSHSNIRYYDYNFPITTPYIELFDKVPDTYPKNALAHPAGEVFDRQGKFVHNVLSFDNGVDDWQEGLRRYVDDNAKVGFVNKKGDIIISAQYDYVSAFQYGYALVYTGNWQKDCNPDCIGFKAVDDTATTYFINQKGEKIDGYDTPKHPKDMQYQGKYYPYPFIYNAFEQKLLDELKGLDKDSYLEITEKPTEYFPYYRIEVFDKQSFILDNDLSYLINANGQVFKEEYNGVLTFIKEINFLEE
ncbi:MAG: WG repeat-containing protein [Moraxella sp.]|uniref:WG repeat-containing protein n=1 Tax=Moraxella sp. TaxID=479 RepID=UPI0026DB3148|nr:WG repeat-containing protein [Moraxella sp.]MDO4450909.1 WG repeat-containing protein [Moraxella sp.]